MGGSVKWAVCLGLLASWVCAAAVAGKAAAVPVIYDTDIDSDVDDVGALAVLHALASRGEANLLAVITTTEDIHGPACVAAINTYFNRPDIPIGVNKEARPDPALPRWLHLRSGFSRYARTIAREYPHTLESYDHAECATALYRRALASQEDNSVVIVTVGHLTNLKNLLLSAPDEHSPLYGFALVQRKVKLWSGMGGMYPGGKEANFYRPHPESTVVCVNNWPTKVVFSGWELGRDIITGGESFRRKIAKDSPVRRAYELYNNFAGRHSWDQTSVLYAVRGTANGTLWSVQWVGANHVFPDGSNEWRASPDNANHGYLIPKMDPEKIAHMLEELMLQGPAN
jgi:purine nucleosidase